MNKIRDFKITQKWQPQYPEKIQYYGMPTPNGMKVSIMLEETELPYEAHRVDITKDESHDPAFLSLNPNGKIPAILDPSGPEGEPMPLWESGAILLYLAKKADKFLPDKESAKMYTIKWLMFQMSAIGPIFGQLGYFYNFAGKEIEDKRPLERFTNESKRLLSVLDERLEPRKWIMGGEYTIADISMFGWVKTLSDFYDAGDLLQLKEYKHVQAWLDRGLDRPAVQKGMKVAG